ncbi:MAG: TldD/PmbA family protein [Candidatus Methanofastidiosia archaeon]|jgi:PmbA protein
MMDNATKIKEKALALGATDVVVKGISSQNKQVRFSNNDIDIAKTWHELMFQVFLAYKNRVVTTEILDINTMEKTLENLISMAKMSRENPEYAGIAKGPFSYNSIESDPQLKGLTDVSDYVFAAVNKALEYAQTTFGILYVTNEEVYISTSNGIEVKDEHTSIELSIRAFSQKEASGHGVNCSPTLKEFNPEKAGEKAGELSKLAKNPVLGEEGAYNIVFSPLFFGSVLSYSINMASAYQVFAGRSMYGERLGKKVASDVVTITDVPSGMKQYRCDDEGVPTQKTVVIQDGVLQNYLHNTSTATKLHTETTANAGLIVPKPINIAVTPGEHTTEELFQEMKNGLYLTNTWYTRFQNMQTGDFSTIPRDAILKVENGEITGSIKNIRVSDNLLQVYKNIEAFSNQPTLVHWWAEADFPCITPYVLARNVHITRSTE